MEELAKSRIEKVAIDIIESCRIIYEKIDMHMHLLTPVDGKDEKKDIEKIVEVTREIMLLAAAFPEKRKEILAKQIK